MVMIKVGIDMNELKALWDSSASLYNEHTKKFVMHRKITTFLLSIVNTNPRKILDFGCGPGNSTMIISNYFSESKIMGLDYSKGMIDIALDKINKNTEFVCNQIDNFVYNKIIFDLIICSNSFFHVENKSELLSTFHKIMGKDSILVFSMYESVFIPDDKIVLPFTFEQEDNLMRLLLKKIQEEGIYIEKRKESREVFSQSSLRDLFDKNGFQIKLGGILRITRSLDERLNYFKIPIISQEVFPDIDNNIICNIINNMEISIGEEQERNIYGFLCKKI